MIDIQKNDIQCVLHVLTWPAWFVCDVPSIHLSPWRSKASKNCRDDEEDDDEYDSDEDDSDDCSGDDDE